MCSTLTYQGGAVLLFLVGPKKSETESSTTSRGVAVLLTTTKLKQRGPTFGKKIKSEKNVCRAYIFSESLNAG